MKKLDWAYAIGELIIVTAGVLVALAIGQWNSDRLDRREEALIIERLLTSLETDRAGTDQGLTISSEKAESLILVDATLRASDQQPTDLKAFLQAVIDGSNYGWNQFRVDRATFEELLGSGQLSLITDLDVRSAISAYYARDLSISNRIDERETPYPGLSYALVPRSTEYELAKGLADAELEYHVRRVFESELRDHTIGELNLAQFIHEIFLALETQRAALVETLDAHLDAIR